MTDITLQPLEDAMARAEAGGWAEMVKTDADRRFIQRGGYFDVATVVRIVAIISTFVLSIGRWANKTIDLLDWQINEMVGPIWGWKWPDGSRRYRRVFCYLPKKQGKTTLCACLGLILLAFDGEAGARVYSCARARDQAALVWLEAQSIINATPELRGHFIIVPSSWLITHPESGSEWKVLPKGAETKEGLNASGIVIDELHVIDDPRLLPALLHSGAARLQPIQIIITTAGEDTEGTVWGEEYELAKAIRDGEHTDDTYLPVIYEADLETMDPGSEVAWAAANPSYGQIVRRQEMETLWADAQTSPEKLADFIRYRLNVPQKTSRGAVDMLAWAKCNGPVDLDELRGRPCLLAFDLGARRDMAAVVALFAPPSLDEMLWSIVPAFFLPEAALEPPPHGVKDILGKPIREKYFRWKRDGLLTVTKGEFTDYRVIYDYVVEMNRKLNPREVLFDPWDATKIVGELRDAKVPVVQFNQTMEHYAPGCKDFVEQALPSHQFAHAGHPILYWNAQNLSFFININGHRRPIKSAGKKKVDGMVCFLMAYCRALTMKDLIPKVPIYAKRGFITV